MHQLLLMAHLILIATGTGMAFSNYINIRVAAGEKGERFAVLAYVRRTIGQIGDVVLTLIWITGIVLVWTRMSLGIYEPSGWFYAKVAFVVLLLWIPLRQKPGLGTLLNILVIPIALQLTYDVLPEPGTWPLRLALSLLGIATIGLGSGFYLTAGHGPGPRDGWMTGLHHRTGRPVGQIRLMIEVVVLVIGVALGGTFGIGTVLFALLIGQAVALGLQVVTHLAPPLPHEGPPHP